RSAARGGTVAEVERAAVAAVARSDMYFMVTTLEYLRRGGRIGPGAAALGTALAVKPVLRMVDGVITPIEKVRTTQRALTRPAVRHLGAARLAAELADGLLQRVLLARSCAVSEVGAVIGAHTGPGVLGVSIQR